MNLRTRTHINMLACGGGVVGRFDGAMVGMHIMSYAAGVLRIKDK